MLPVFDLSTPAGRAGLDGCLQRLRTTAGAGGEVAKVVAEIVADVQAHGDEALVVTSAGSVIRGLAGRVCALVQASWPGRRGVWMRG